MIGFQPVSMPTPAYRPAAKPVSQPKFGFDVTQIVKLLTANPQLKNGQESNGFSKFFLKNVMLPVMMTLALMNVPWGVSQIRQVENRVFNNVSLTSVEPPPNTDQSPTLSRDDLLALISNPGIKLTQDHVLDMARSGFIKEVLVPNIDENKVIVVLKNGHEVNAEADNATRAKLITRFKINVDRPPLSNLNFDFLTASALSGFLVFGLQALMGGTKKLVKTIRKDPDIRRRKRRMASLETGYSLMALKLGVTKKPVRFQTLEAKVSSLREKLLNGRESSRSNPELDEIVKWMTIMLAGVHMERRLFNRENGNRGADHTSIDANSFRADISDLCRTLVKQYGLEPKTPSGYLPGTPADLEARAQALFDEMGATVRQVLDPPPVENLEELRRAMEKLGSFSKHKFSRDDNQLLTLHEMEAIINDSKTLGEILDARELEKKRHRWTATA